MAVRKRKPAHPPQARKRTTAHASSEPLERRILLSAILWTGNAQTTDWDTPGNWSGDAIPTSADDVTIPANVTIDHAAANVDAVNSLTCGAGDTLNLSNGSITFENASNVANLNLSGGDFISDAPVTIWGADSTFTGGYFTSDNGSTALNTGTLTMSSGDPLLYNSTLENSGTIIDSAADLHLFDATVQNDSGGVINFQNASDVLVSSDGGENAFNNLSGGTVIKSTGAGNVTFDSGVNYSSLGTTEVDAASLFINGDSLSQATGSALTGGTWVAKNASLITAAIPAIATIDAGASVTLCGPTSSWPSIADADVSGGGALSLLKGASLSDSNSFTNAGALTIGTGSTSASGSGISTAGAYTQTTGALTLDIGGAPASGEYGSITAGNVALGGTFSGKLVNGFSPNPGDQYIVINNEGTSPVAGTFSGLPEGDVFLIGGVKFKISYAGGPGNDVVLTVLPQADLAITDTDGTATAVPGGTTTYTVTVTNAGPSDVPLDAATITDTLPASVLSDSWTAVYSSGGSGPASGTGNIDAGIAIPAGGTATFTLIAAIAPGATGSLSNAASVSVDPTQVCDANTSNNSATDTDTLVPTVTSVASTAANGSYTAGAVIPIVVTFSEPVSVTGTPQLALNCGGLAVYAGGSGTATLTFTYTVAAGQTAAVLDEASASGLTLNGGTILDLAGNAASLSLPTPGAAGSLSSGSSIVIDTTAPTITGVTSTTPSGTYGPSTPIPINVTFSEPVTVTGLPQLELNSGGDAVSPITLLAAQPAQTYNIGFIGDSITAGVGSATTPAPAAMIADLNAQGIAATGVNCGVSGTTTAQWVPGASGSYLPGAISAFEAANVNTVCIMLGTNDCKQEYIVPTTPAQYIANLTQIVAALHSAGIQNVIINEPPYPTPGASADTWTAASVTLMQQYISLLNTVPGAIVGDRTAFAETEDHPDMLVDGIHPDQAGHFWLGAAWEVTVYRATVPRPWWAVFRRPRRLSAWP